MADSQSDVLTPGNIDLANRPQVRNPDGSISTVRSISINENGKEILIPTVVGGTVVSDADAIRIYHRTGQHLGIFPDAATATRYAKQLHDDQAKLVANPQDPLTALLTKAPIGASVRADAWDAYQQASSEDDLVAKLQKLPMPQETKAALWDLKHQGSFALGAEGMGQKESASAGDDTGVGAFVSHAASQVNPLPAINTLAQALPIPKALGGGGVPLPKSIGGSGMDAASVRTIQQIGAAQGVPFDKAKASYAKGDYGTAARHFVDYLIPLIGPAVDQSADELQAGHYAAGLGDAVGLGMSMFAPELLNQYVAAASQSSRAQRIADSAETGSINRFSDVMTPKGSSKEIRQLGKQGQAVAGAVREGTTAITPAGLQAQVTDRLSQAGEALDAAYQAIPSRVGYSVQPVVNKLQTALNNLKRQGTGGSVISAANVDRAAALEQAIAELKKIGPFTSTQELAKLRGDWKALGKDAFVPSINPNFQQIRGASKGWADAYSSLQDALVERHPELRALNSDYHVWKQAADVMQALEDQQRVKPTVGRTIMSRAGGAAAGAAVGGGGGMVVGEVLGPVVERGISNRLAPAMKLIVARKLGDMADAIRTGNAARAEFILKSIRPLLVANAPQHVGSATPSMMPAQASQ